MDEPQPQDARLAGWIVDHAGAVGAALIGLTLVALVGVLRLDFSDNPRDIFTREDEESAYLETLHESFGADDTDILVVLDGEDLLSIDSLRRIEALAETLREHPGLASVYTLLDARRAVRLGRRTAYWMILPPADREEIDPELVRERLREHPTIKDRMLSPDGRTTIIVAQMQRGGADAAEIAALVEQVRTMAQSAFADTSTTVRLTGQPPLRVDTFHNLKTDQVTFSVACGAALCLIALLLFRRPSAVIVSLAGPGIGVLWTLGLMGWTGQRFDGINVVLPMLLFVIGFTDSLHLVVAMRSGQRAGESARDAAVKALSTLGYACFCTSLTTAIGFGSLSISSLESVHRFGLYAAAGAMMLFVAVVTTAPILTQTHWLRRLVDRKGAETIVPASLLNTVLALLLRAPIAVSAVGVVGVVLLACEMRRLPFDMQWSEALPTSGETVEALRRLDDQMGGSVLAHVVVRWPEGTTLYEPELFDCVREVHGVLHEYHDNARRMRLGAPTSLLTVLQGLQAEGDTLESRIPQLRKRAPERFARLVDLSERKLIVSVPIPEAGARALLPVFEEIDVRLNDIAGEFPGYALRLTGSTVVSARNLYAILHELVQSVLLAAAIVFVVLCIAFRSVWLGLLSVAPNSMPLVVVIATLVWTETPMQVTAALTLCLSLGVAVDDTIHLVSRYQRERRRGNSGRESCVLAFRAVGQVIVMTTVILVCGFSTMLLSESPAIGLFGALSCVALLAALLGDLVLLPALLLVGQPRTPG